MPVPREQVEGEGPRLRKEVLDFLRSEHLFAFSLVELVQQVVRPRNNWLPADGMESALRGLLEDGKVVRKVEEGIAYYAVALE